MKRTIVFSQTPKVWVVLTADTAAEGSIPGSSDKIFQPFFAKLWLLGSQQYRPPTTCEGVSRSTSREFRPGPPENTQERTHSNSNSRTRQPRRKVNSFYTNFLMIPKFLFFSAMFTGLSFRLTLRARFVLRHSRT